MPKTEASSTGGLRVTFIYGTGSPFLVFNPLIYQYSVQWLYSTGQKFTEI